MSANDIVIVGGGIMGCATAYALSRRSAGRIVIIEQDTSYQAASTTRSAGGVRMQFSTPENIAMSQATVSLLRNLKSEFGPDADVSFREQGYLILATSSGQSVLAANVATQTQMGADVALLDSGQLQRQFPWLNGAGLAAGSFGRSGEGWVDPSALLALIRKAAQKVGVTIVRGRVVGVDRTANRVTSVTLEDGERLSGGTFVNTAGAWSATIARLAGGNLPVEPRKRYVYVVDQRNSEDALHRAPLTVDPTGVWFRPESGKFICGVSPSEADEPAAENLDEIDEAPFYDSVWPALAERVPSFQSLKLVSSWAGYYDYNTLDQNALIGRQPGIDNLFVATGFSGHGLQQGYAAGRAISELILDGRFTTIDLSRFALERVAANAPIYEANVI